MMSAGQLDVLPTENEHIVKILIWAAILAILLSQAFYRLFRTHVPGDRFMPMLRWAKLFARFANALLAALFSGGQDSLHALLTLMAHDAEDPNRSRKKRALHHVAEMVAC